MVKKRIGLLSALALLLTMAPAVSVGPQEPTARAEAACTKAPAWKKKDTRFGIGLSTSDAPNLGADLVAEQKRFRTRIPVIRTWDTGMPRDYAWEERSKWFGKRWIVTSLKLSPQEVNAGTHDNALRNYFKTAPRKQPIFYSFFHEPEDEVKNGQFTTAQYRAAFRRIVDIASSFCRSNLYPTLVLMGWTADPSSRLDWRDYYPGADYVSVLGWDPYNGANGYASSYRPPRQIFGHVVAASRAAGKPFGIAETGSVRIAGDASGKGRATWLRKSRRYLDRKNAAFVTYFQSTNKGDFELRDDPSIGAWRRAMRSHR